MQVSQAFSRLYRYCEYLGKYHCTNCHRNQMATIPARVLAKWDFSVCPVSVFAYRLLEDIWTRPLFRIADINAQLYDRVWILNWARQMRTTFRFVVDFIQSCRFARSEQDMLKAVPDYFTADPEIWSMMDLEAVKNGSFKRDLAKFTASCEGHIFGCEVSCCRGG